MNCLEFLSLMGECIPGYIWLNLVLRIASILIAPMNICMSEREPLKFNDDVFLIDKYFNYSIWWALYMILLCKALTLITTHTALNSFFFNTGCGNGLLSGVTKPLPQLILSYYHLDPEEKTEIWKNESDNNHTQEQQQSNNNNKINPFKKMHMNITVTS